MEAPISPNAVVAPPSRWTHRVAGLVAALLAGLGGLAVARLGYEALFPQGAWLGSPAGVLLLAVLAVGGGWLLWRRGGHGLSPIVAAVPFLPLLLNLLWLFDPTVNLVRSRLLFAAGLWLAVALLLLHRPWRRVWALWPAVLLLPIYLLTMGRTVGQADTFEFQVVIPQLGIAHPTGYPLYMLLGKLFTFIPAGTVAWRINLASVVFALGAVTVVCFLVQLLTGRTLPAMLAAVVLGLMPTFWSQAIEAEVYALQSLLVATALYLMVRLCRREQECRPALPILLALTLGLGLANHLTAVLLLPAAGLALFFHFRRCRPAGKTLLSMVLAFLLPLLLYVYLPLRWAAVNGEPMGAARFVDWVIGGRFQGALQLRAWLSDPARYEVVGRLFLAEWQPPVLLVLVLVGVAALFLCRQLRRWPAGLILLLVWLADVFYALNYYVPDLAVFLLPAFLVTAVFWGVGLAALLDLAERYAGRFAPLVTGLLLVLAVAPLLLHTGNVRWIARDRSGRDGQTIWGRAVLSQDLPQGAAILADSDKFPPLYYLQQAEGLRPDLHIMVLPDEAAYRAELQTRLTAGQPVYLARYIPGLEGSYHLRSLGPLTEVDTAPLGEVPAGLAEINLPFGSLRLVGYELASVAAYDPAATALTLYWEAAATPAEAWHVYTRWAGDNYEGAPLPAGGQHPANDDYPTVAWEAGEVVPDFHLLPRPVLPEAQELALQVALAPPFTRPEALDWQTVTTLLVEPPQTLAATRPLRLVAGAVVVDGVQLPTQARPGNDLPLLLTGSGATPGELVFTLRPAGEAPQAAHAFQTGTPTPGDGSAFVWPAGVSTQVPPGRYHVYALHQSAAARCGWLAPLTEGCVLGTVEISGVPLPEGAVNFDDKIALLGVTVPETQLQPGGQLALTIEWQSLAPLGEDYTVFVQVLDEQDRIVGQVDSWPLQGTYPTSNWPAGEQIRDPYVVQLEGNLPAGSYRLAIGWYLLATLQRLPVLDEGGNMIDNRYLFSGLTVE